MLKEKIDERRILRIEKMFECSEVCTHWRRKLTILKGPLKIPLLKMSRWNSKVAGHMASEISHWIEMSNGGWNREVKATLIASISRRAERDNILKSELHLQLLKQTKAPSHLFRENNAWKLWVQIAENVECCSVNVHAFGKTIDSFQELQCFLNEYWESVFASAQYSTCARWHAYQLLKAHRPREFVDLNLSRFRECDVTLGDDRKNKMIYDDLTTVAEVVPYIAWEIGLKHYETFALYRSRERELKKLNPKDRFAEVAQEVLYQKHTSETRLSMLSHLHHLSQEQSNDEMMVHLMYHAARREFFDEEEMSLNAGNIISLCTLQIQAAGHVWLFENQSELQRNLFQYVPPRVRNQCFYRVLCFAVPPPLF